MGLDIRIPIGAMFALLGLLLTGYGAVSDRAIYAKSLGLNVNLGWGIVLLAFGGVMLALARRKPPATPAAGPAESPRAGSAASRR